MNYYIGLLLGLCVAVGSQQVWAQMLPAKPQTTKSESDLEEAFNEKNADIDTIMPRPSGFDGLLDKAAEPRPESDNGISTPPQFSEMLDFLMHSWAVKRSRPADCFPDESMLPLLPDSVYKERLTKLPCVMEMPYNSSVQSFINMYTVQKRRQVEYMLGIGRYYFPFFEQALAANSMPLELKYLPVIESALNPNAYSRVGAAGLWQFMIGTGRVYGLEINSLVDERLDPGKATEAAIQYLKELYSIYGDWHLVIAAYNCGPGNVRKAISRSGGKRDYWAIYPHLPRETRGYVPIFIAATYTMEYAREHKLCPSSVESPVLTDTIHVGETIHFEQIAGVIGISVEELRFLNPQYRKNIVPGQYKPYPIRLPHHYLNPFIKRYKEIVEHRADELINNRRSEIEVSRSSYSGSGRVVYHSVRQGQTLGQIARRYGVSVNKLRQWNHLRGNTIRVGQRLKIMK